MSHDLHVCKIAQPFKCIGSIVSRRTLISLVATRWLCMSNLHSLLKDICNKTDYVANFYYK